jgi:HEPN domain-containing protein
MAKKPKPVPDAKKVYEHALRFLATDGFLRTEAAKDPAHGYWFQHPGMVISTFASELLLKCLLILEGKAPPDKHNLKTLFDLLDPAHKAQIETMWDADQAKRKAHLDEQERKMGVTIPRGLTTALSDCQDAFVLLRYLYEDPMKASYYITFFPHIVRDVIRDITGWKD